MKTPSAPPRAEERSYASIVLISLIVIAFVAIVVAVVVRREPDYALVLATPQDCLRAFDDAKCRDIVARAMAIHTATAPRYATQELCALEFGADGCTSFTSLNDTFFAPSAAAIVVDREKLDDPKGMVPLYYGSRDQGNETGRQVSYRGLAVGKLRIGRFGGASMSILADLKGRPLTSESIKALR
jgi:uncharacterized protein YgiB involved in biofilm formation